MKGDLGSYFSVLRIWFLALPCLVYSLLLTDSELLVEPDPLSQSVKPWSAPHWGAGISEALDPQGQMALTLVAALMVLAVLILTSLSKFQLLSHGQYFFLITSAFLCSGFFFLVNLIHQNISVPIFWLQTRNENVQKNNISSFTWMALCEMKQLKFSARYKEVGDAFSGATCVYRCRSVAGPAVPDVISGVFPHDLSCRSPCGTAALMNYAAPSAELGSRENVF